MLVWKRSLAGVLFLSMACCAIWFASSATLIAQESPPGKANELRAQLEKLQSALREVELKDEQRGKVTEIGSSRGRLRETDEPRLVVKVYDLSDLFTVAPTYPAYEPLELLRASEPQPVFPHMEGAASNRSSGAGFGGGGGGLFAVPNAPERPATVRKDAPATLHQASGASGAAASSVRTSMESLIDTITGTIDPSGWSDVGGHSTISPVGSSLLVSTTSETHAKLTALIDLFRQRWGSLRTISVHAHWLWLSPSQVDAAIAPAAADAKEQVAAEAKEQVAANSVAPDAWKKLLAAAEENAGRSSYHAIVTCYNGQTVAAQAGSQRLTVIGLTPVVTPGEYPTVAFNPVLRTVHEGATLQITPLATRHVKYVVLDVHSRVNLLAPQPKVAEKVDPQATQQNNDTRRLVEALDRGAVQTQRLETTLRVPVGQPTLIGGMTFAGSEGKNSHLYLFITAKVQELRDDDPTVAPTTLKAEAALDKPAEKDTE